MNNTVSSKGEDLTRRVAVVTGGGRGLGALFAEGLAAAGMAVVVVARTTAEVQATAQRIRAAGGQALALTADVSDRQAVEQMVAAAEAQVGAVEVLVNNAGLFGAFGPVWEVHPEEWWREMEVNVRGPFLCARAVLPGMIARRRGRIINVASGAGTGPIPAVSAYAASKAALISFTNSLAGETAPYGISVFAINPGTVRTPMNEVARQSPVLAQWHPWFAQLFEEGGDVPAEPAVRLVVALASGQADPLTGRFLDVGDDLTHLVQDAETIRRDDLYTLRLRTPAAG